MTEGFILVYLELMPTDREALIKLTCEVYKLTSLFPKKEPLRWKMRDLSTEILADFLKTYRGRTSVDLEKAGVLDGYFEVAKSQNWTSENELLNLQAEYIKLSEEMKGSEAASSVKVESVSLRQKRILELLKDRDNFQVWQVKELFPDVSKRTLRRDFEGLLKQGLIQRVGERNDTFYQLS